MTPEKILWKVYAGALGAVTTIVSQKIVEGAWKYVTGDEETPQPDDPEAVSYTHLTLPTKRIV